MADRYSKLFSLAKNLYVEGSPVIIAAGALLLDNKTNQVLAQLKVRNNGKKAIKAVTVKICPYDTAGRQIGEPVMSQYLDLVLERDQEFGQKLPITLPNNATRSFSVCVTEVVFGDNEIWTCNQDEWKSLPEAKPLQSWLTDSELQKQYKLQYGQDSSYVPEKVNDLWYCACGAINHKNEETCHICGKTLAALLSVDLNQLNAEKDARLMLEAEAEAVRLKKEEEEAEHRKREAEEKAAAKRAKAQNRTIIVLATLAALIGLTLLLIKVIIPNSRIRSQKELLSKHYSDILVGSTIKLGLYEQDNNTIDGKEEIEWIVLAVEGDRALVISKYALDCQAYNDVDDPITWEECTLRNWLNSDFYQDAFENHFEDIIIESLVPADENPIYYYTPVGNSTMDKLFLLSISEAEEYFATGNQRQCQGTAFCFAQGAKQLSDNLCSWWLRSPGIISKYAVFVNSDSSINKPGFSVNYVAAVRPAMWINLEP